MDRNEDLDLRSEPWFDLLTKCQETVSSLDPHPYYLQAYRAAEFHYWGQIPHWMYEDVVASWPATCLDIGCAYGTLLLYVKELSGCDAYGLDATDRYISQTLVRTHRLNFATCNIELDPVPWNRQFDVVVLTEVLEHFNFHPIPTLRKIGDLLADNGRLYVSTPDAAHWGQTTVYHRDYRDMPQPSESRRSQIVDDHVWHYSQDELLEIFYHAGLQVLRFDLSTGTPFPHFNLTLRRST